MYLIFKKLFLLIHWYLRPIIKWFLHKTTRLCELQRICYGEESGASRTLQVEYSLEQSRKRNIVQVLDHLTQLAESGRFTEGQASYALGHTIETVMNTKDINPQVHRRFLTSLNTCLLQIYGYKQLVYEVENLRKTAYSSDNVLHERKLEELWKLLMPDVELTNRVSKQWTDIGFQGDDPKTDFRGMGCLGLDNLLFFSTVYTEAARHVLSHSQHPQYGYSFAIVGINLTSLTYHFLLNGKLKVHFYNWVNGCPQMEDFHHAYCYFFYEFDKMWLSEKPRDIMEFNRIRDKFEEKMALLLEKPGTILKFNMAVETL